MLSSPFACLRGSAAVMVADLAPTLRSDISVQACGDCHLSSRVQASLPAKSRRPAALLASEARFCDCYRTLFGQLHRHPGHCQAKVNPLPYS